MQATDGKVLINAETLPEIGKEYVWQWIKFKLRTREQVLTSKPEDLKLWKITDMIIINYLYHFTFLQTTEARTMSSSIEIFMQNKSAFPDLIKTTKALIFQDY